MVRLNETDVTASHMKITVTGAKLAVTRTNITSVKILREYSAIAPNLTVPNKFDVNRHGVMHQNDLAPN